MLTITNLKILGVLLGLAGTAILAIRVTKILSALSMAVEAHDLNFQIRAELAKGNRFTPPIQVVGSSTHVETAERVGVALLVIGFLFQIAGGACTAVALFLE